MLTKVALTTLAVSALALSGCGGSDDGSDEGGTTSTSISTTTSLSGSSNELEGAFSWSAQTGFDSAASASNSVLETENPELDVTFGVIPTVTLEGVCSGLSDAALAPPMPSTPCDVKSTELGEVGNPARGGGPAVLYYLEDSAVIKKLAGLIEFHADI